MIDPDTLEPFSEILEEWHYDDPTTFVMTLKPGITFSNGDEAKAEDLLFSVTQHFERKSAFTKWIGDLNVEACYTEGDYTAVLKYNTAYGPGLWCNVLYLFDKSWCEAEGWDSEKWYSDPNGSGPYKVLEYVRDDHFTVVPKDNYWNAANEEYAVKEWIYKYYPDQTTLSMALEIGDIDMCGIPVSDYSRMNSLGEDSGVGVVAQSAGTNMIFTMSGVENPIFNDINVREALAYGVDWAAIGESVMGELYKPATSCLISDSLFYENVGAYEFDQERAKQALERGGYKDGDISFKMLCMTGSEYEAIAQGVQFYLDQIGIKFEIIFGDMVDVFTKWTQPGNSDVGCMTYGQGSASAEPHHALAHFYKASNLFAYSSDEEAKALGLEALACTDFEQRKELYSEFQNMVKDEYLIIPIYENYACLAYDSTIFTKEEMEDLVVHPLYVRTRELSRAQ
jgi:ABC-type transport system substrate-binding protein